MKNIGIVKAALAVAMAVVLLPGCKKDEEETTLNYVGGTLSFSIPYFVRYGESYTLEPKGAYHPEARKIAGDIRVDTLGYYFVNPITGKSDTTKIFGWPAQYKPGYTSKNYTFTVTKDTLATLTFTAYAYAPNYYSNSATREFMIVSPEKSLLFFPLYFGDTVVTIEGKTYPAATTLDGKTWMRKNLATEGKGYPYFSCEAMTDIFGMYYSWEDALTVCPSGWHLPTCAEWRNLLSAYNNEIRHLINSSVYFNYDKPNYRMWKYSYNIGDGDDTSHLTLLTTGFGTLSGKAASFSGALVRGTFWTADEYDAEKAYCVDFYSTRENPYYEPVDKANFIAPVRCVKD